MEKERYAFIYDCINGFKNINDIEPPLSLGEKIWYEKRRLEIEAMRREIPDAIYDPWIDADDDFDAITEQFDPDKEYADENFTDYYHKGKISQGTAAFLVASEKQDIESFADYLLSMGYKYATFPKGKSQGVNWIYINMNSKLIHWGLAGFPVTEAVGDHAITIEEFLTIHRIYQKYTDLPPLVFIREEALCED